LAGRSETLTRSAVAAVGIPLALGAVYLGGWVLGGVLALCALLAALELFRMSKAKGAAPLAGVGAAGAAAFVLAATYAAPAGLENPLLPLVLLLVVASATTASIWTRGVEGQPLLSVSVTVFGAGYTSLLLFGVLLRHLPGVESAWHGTWLLMAPVVLTWLSDTFAYFAGRAWGRRKLIPRVSPGKTVAGAVGALVGTVPCAVAYTWVLGHWGTYTPGWVEAAAFGLVLSVTAQVGDLVESLFKRDAGVKDSGRLLPGHGGALDRFDSLFFTLPLGYLFFRWVVGP
jgi:phosphatidate cytidylyltransferase